MPKFNLEQAKLEIARLEATLSKTAQHMALNDCAADDQVHRPDVALVNDKRAAIRHLKHPIY